MDSDTEALKQQLEELKRITVDTNRVIHGMRRGQRWRSFFGILWWAAVIGFSGVTYYYYVQPYVDQAQHAYGNAQNFQSQIQDFLSQFNKAKTQ